jgi:hypothetical protein
MPVKPEAGESKDQFVSRCIGEEVSAGYDTPQAAAICYSYWDKENMSKIKYTEDKVMARVAYDSKFRGINLQAAGLEDACWPGYEAIGTKDMDGREVPNCVPIKE